MRPDALVERGVALLQRLLKFDAPADGVVSAFFRAHHGLGQRDRHVLAETAYAVLRRLLLYRHLAQSGPGPIERRLVLLGWQGDEAFLDAALAADERVWLNRCRSIDVAALPDRLRHNLPDWIADPLRDELGVDEFRALADALLQPAPLDLRVNLLKAKREAVQRVLADAGVDAALTPHSPWGLRLAGRPALNRLDAFARGEFEVQDEGSQLLVLLADPKRGEMVVDFCAGAGGKTLALGAAMRNTGRLYAWDTSAHRLDAMKLRLARSGLSNVHPARLAHERDERVKRLAGKVHRVLVDAPCSGLGTLRRNPDLKWRQSPQAVDEMQARQRAILESAARLPMPGGRLVYATCSLLRAENESVADDFTRRHADSFEPLPAGELLVRAGVAGAHALDRDGFLRLWPHRHGTDGFFAAVWQRR